MNPRKATKVLCLGNDAVLCQATILQCNGVYACNQLRENTLPIERFEVDLDAQKAIIDAERDLNEFEHSSMEVKVAQYILRALHDQYRL